MPGLGQSLEFEDASEDDSELQEAFQPQKRRKAGNANGDSDNSGNSSGSGDSDDDDDEPAKKKAKKQAAVGSRVKTPGGMAKKFAKAALDDTIRDGKVVPLAELPPTASKPLQLFDVKSSFRVALDSLMLQYTVERPDKTTDVAEAFREKATVFKQHPFMQQIPWEQSIEQVKTFGAEVQMMITELNDWTLPVDVSDKRKKFDRLKETFTEALSVLQEYEETIDKLSSRERSAEEAKKAKLKHIIHRLYQMCVRHLLPRGIAKVSDEK